MNFMELIPLTASPRQVYNLFISPSRGSFIFLRHHVYPVTCMERMMDKEKRESKDRFAHMWVQSLISEIARGYDCAQMLSQLSLLSIQSFPSLSCTKQKLMVQKCFF